MKAIIFAQKLVNITNEDIERRKSLLHDDNESWMNIDLTKSIYDGTEVYELVGTFPLYKLSQKYNKNNIGLIVMMV